MSLILQSKKPPQALKGVRILSLSPNLPGPAALQRCRTMGATCIKIEPPAPLAIGPVAAANVAVTGDPMSSYSQKTLQRELLKADVLLTSFRPSALTKLGLDWRRLHKQHPQLSMVAIFGDSGAHAEDPGHDLTYMAQAGLLPTLEMPATLYADMAGALMASEAVLQAVLLQRRDHQGSRLEVSLAAAAAHLAQPHSWGSMAPDTLLGGGHAGYRIYPCRDGRVALAALEPHFAQRLCVQADIHWTDFGLMLQPSTQQQIAQWASGLTCAALNQLSTQYDIPLHTLLNT